MKVKVLGVGNGAIKVLNEISRSGSKIETVALNTDVLSIDQCQASKKILLGSSGTGTRGDLGSAETAAMSSRRDISLELSDADAVVILSMLGGGVGSGAAPVVAGISYMMGIQTIALVTKPFSFESPRSSKYAETAIDRLKRVTDGLMVIDYRKVERSPDITSLPPQTPMSEFMKVFDMLVAESVKAIVGAVERNVDKTLGQILAEVERAIDSTALEKMD